MSLPSFGNQSEAFDATWTKEVKTRNIYEVVIRSGNIVVTVAERGSATPSMGPFDAFIHRTLSKLPFGGTPPPTTNTTTTATTQPPLTTTTTRPPPTTTTTRPSLPTTTTTAAPSPATTPPTTGCYRDPEGNCYRAGEY